MVIFANEVGRDICVLIEKKIDIDLNDQSDFEVVVDVSSWQDDFKKKNSRIYIADTEYGGLVGGLKTDTSAGTVTIAGHTWRGILKRKVIEPPAGQAYKVISGELNTCIRELTKELSVLFYVPDEDSGATVTNFQFDRYTTLLAGIEKMLKSKGYKLAIRYVKEEKTPGYVELKAAPIEDYSSTTELSQDTGLNFTFEETKNGVNHLICLGQGELTSRVVKHLYIQADGSVGNTQYFFGVDEETEVYEDTNAEADELIERGTEKLLELASRQIFKMDIADAEKEYEIGDIIGGRDYITGMSMKKPIVNKIYTEQNGRISKDYKLEGDEA